jgi:hypothetical protein
VFNRRLWMSGTVRIVQPLADQVVTRRPLFADTALFIPAAVASATRNLGRRVEIEIAPRYVINPFFGISGGYVLHRRDGDQYAFPASAATPASTTQTKAGTYQGFLLGATFSTLASYTRGRSKWPVEVSFIHTEPLSGSGNVPAIATDRLEMRAYTGFPRR